MNKKYIAESFGKAKDTYENDAPVQKWTAGFLRDYITRIDDLAVRDALEIGCGTGFLTQEVLELFPNANWTITDLSSQMLEQCQARVGKKAKFQVMDGEHPDQKIKFDLIVSSLAFQWFHDLEQGLKQLSKLLKPKGRLIFTTLGHTSFQEWRDHLNALNLPIGLHDYPCVDGLEKITCDGFKTAFMSYEKHQSYHNGFDFLRAIKAIGAQAPKDGYEKLGAGALRKALLQLDQCQDCQMTYEIIIGDIEALEA